MRLWAGSLVALAVLAGCVTEPDDDARPDVDSTLVDVLATLHLADARAALDPDTLRRSALADSLRAAALADHGLTPVAWDDRVARLADDPSQLTATFDALDARLGHARQRLTP